MSRSARVSVFRRIETPAICILVSVIGGPLAAQAADGSAQVGPHVEAMRSAFEQADADRIAAFYAPDAVVLSPEGVIPARSIADALRAHFARIESQVFAFDTTRSLRLGPDLVLFWMVGRTEGISPAGEVVFSAAVAVSLLWRRGPDGWKIMFSQETLSP